MQPLRGIDADAPNPLGLDCLSLTLRREEIDQHTRIPVGQHFTHRRCIAGNDAAASRHGLQQTPAQHEWHREIEVHIATCEDPLISLGLQWTPTNEYEEDLWRGLALPILPSYDHPRLDP